MLAVAIAFAVAMGRSPFFPLQLMTAMMVGPSALEVASPSTIVPGFLAHQIGPSLLWSKAFGLVVAFKSTPWRLTPSLLVGAATGIVALVIDVYLFVPRLQMQFHARDLWSEHMSNAGSWVTHVVFGLSLGTAFWSLQERAVTTVADSREAGV